MIFSVKKLNASPTCSKRFLSPLFVVVLAVGACESAPREFKTAQQPGSAGVTSLNRQVSGVGGGAEEFPLRKISLPDLSMLGGVAGQAIQFLGGVVEGDEIMKFLQLFTRIFESQTIVPMMPKFLALCHGASLQDLPVSELITLMQTQARQIEIPKAVVDKIPAYALFLKQLSIASQALGDKDKLTQLQCQLEVFRDNVLTPYSVLLQMPDINSKEARNMLVLMRFSIQHYTSVLNALLLTPDYFINQLTLTVAAAAIDKQYGTTLTDVVARVVKEPRALEAMIAAKNVLIDKSCTNGGTDDSVLWTMLSNSLIMIEEMKVAEITFSDEARTTFYALIDQLGLLVKDPTLLAELNKLLPDIVKIGKELCPALLK